MIVNWNAKATKPFIQPESWQNLPKGDDYCQALRQILMPWMPKILMPWMPKILGHQVLKIGGLSGEVTTNLPMHHQIILSEKITPNLTALCNAKVSLIQASLTELPFIQKEIHAVFLMNTLNFAQDPHQIMRESHRVLADDGWIFIALFNPLSPLIFKRKMGDYPLRHSPAWRVIDWLSLLNFEVIEKCPIATKNKRVTIFSPLTLIIAQKRTYPLMLNLEKVRSKIPVFLEPVNAFKLKS